LRVVAVCIALIGIAAYASGCCNPLNCCPLNQISLTPVAAPDRAKLDKPAMPAPIVASTSAQRY
jgi:hypothetical protein